jgi:uncharacterized protein YecE (DUF72 family)
VSDQLSLFEETTNARDRDAAATLARTHAEAAVLAQAIPSGVYFGTSSWSFPGWAGLVYSRWRSTTELAREGLREYARHPLLTTVGIDRSFYVPLPVADLISYRDQLPAGFRCCFKAPAAVTSYTIGAPGARQQPNPDFLSIDRLVDDLLGPLDVAFGDHTGPIILEFPPFARQARLDPHAFLDRLDFFLTHVPRQYELAIELRDRTLLSPRYRQLLSAHTIAHTYNFWSAMPMPAEQADVVPPEEPPFSIIRLLLKPGTWYEEQREAFRPFDRLQAPDESMRADVVTITQRARQRSKRVYILVNNKAEGSSPLTIMELASRLAGFQGSQVPKF